MIQVHRRPSFPGEWNHELIWPLVFLAGVAAASGFFYLGLETPGCVFHGITQLPCFGCGGTRCVRALVQLDFWDAFKFHPALFSAFVLAILWTIYSIIFWLRGDALRLRFSIKEKQANKLTLLAIIFVGLHWAWQCHYLTHT